MVEVAPSTSRGFVEGGFAIIGTENAYTATRDAENEEIFLRLDY
ncbi:hypothetical protein [Amycolatopsis sp. NPDC052450]